MLSNNGLCLVQLCICVTIFSNGSIIPTGFKVTLAAHSYALFIYTYTILYAYNTYIHTYNTYIHTYIHTYIQYNTIHTYIQYIHTYNTYTHTHTYTYIHTYNQERIRTGG